ILPLRNGTEIPLKPPLFHWCGAVIALISGKVNEFAVRSPSAFFAAGSVLLIFFFGQRVWNWRVGLLASLVVATSPEWTRWATYARSDMGLVFFLTAAGLLFFRVWEERASQRRTLYLFYLCIGLATLAKGPLGFVLPGIVGLTFLAISRDLKFLRQLRLFEGAAIVMAVAASWYVLALNQAGWEFFHRQILNENIYRFFDSEQGGPSRDHAWYYYGPALCAGMFPWSLFFPALLHFLYRAREEVQEPRLRYLLVWVLAGLVFFTLASGKRTNYILPLYPAVALLFAVWWEALVEDTITSSVWALRLARINAFILSAVFALLLLFLIAHSAGFDLDHIVSPFLHPRDRANLPLIAYSLQSQFSVVVIWLLIMAFATIWYFWGLKKDQWMYVFAALIVATSSSLYFTNALFHPILARERTYKPFMLGVRSTVKNAPLYFYKDAHDYGAIFYANRHIPSYTADLSTLTIEKDAPSPYYLLMWEKDWQALSATQDQRLEHLVTSEGKGPDKKNKLVLAALIPGRDSPQQKDTGAEQHPSTQATSHGATTLGNNQNAGETPAASFSQQEAPPVKPETGEPPASSPLQDATVIQEKTASLQTAPSPEAQEQDSAQ
ncbi:MAG: glycosyltransferase family 39 protein, partial [Candidatus Caldarchaeum sp.]